VLFFIIVSGALFNFWNIWINTATPLWAVIFTFIADVTYKAVTEGRKKNEMKRIFQRYVSRQVVDEILKDPEKQKLGGARKRITIFFSDIRNFTSMSENLKPEEVVEILNRYFTEMTNIAFKYGGTLDKFVGDAIMLLYGTPIDKGNNEELAVRTAIEMQERMKVLRQEWTTEGKAPLEMGIGINTGDVVVGNIGSGQQMQYTVIGDAANLASRLESITKEYKAGIIISESVYEKIRDIVLVKDLGEASVKGKLTKIKIYEVLGLKK
jgi:adenylate cyclase